MSSGSLGGVGNLSLGGDREGVLLREDSGGILAWRELGYCAEVGELGEGEVMAAPQCGQGPLMPASLFETSRLTWQFGQLNSRVSEAGMR